MAEVFHFDECIVSGTDGAAFASFAEGVTVNYDRELFGITNESGGVIKRFQSGENAGMSIEKMFDADIIIEDGQAINLHYANVLGTTSYQLGSAYIKEKGWVQSDNNPAVRHNVKIVGKTFGTI